MNEFVTAVYEILNAETGDGEELSGVTVLRNDHETLTTLNVGVRRNREVTLEQAHQYKCVEGFLDLYVSVYVDKKSSSELAWYTAEVSAETYARKVEKVLMNNAALVSTSYPNGISYQPQDTHVSEKDYNYRNIQDARFVICKMTLRAVYIYRNGTLALE